MMGTEGLAWGMRIEHASSSSFKRGRERRRDKPQLRFQEARAKRKAYLRLMAWMERLLVEEGGREGSLDLDVTS